MDLYEIFRIFSFLLEIKIHNCLKFADVQNLWTNLISAIFIVRNFLIFMDLDYEFDDDDDDQVFILVGKKFHQFLEQFQTEQFQIVITANND